MKTPNPPLVLGSVLRIRKDLLTNTALSVLRERLSVDNPAYLEWAIRSKWGTAPPKKLVFLTDEGSYVTVPRNTRYKDLLPDIAESEIEHRTQCPPIAHACSFLGSLRDYQEPYLEEVLSLSDFIMDVPCGHGKTVMCLWLIVMRRTPTLVVVPTRQLMWQWVVRIREITNLTVDMMQGKLPEVLPDVLIITLDMMKSREEVFPKSFISHWGQVILDEAHTVGAPTYRGIVETIPAKYIVAASATFRREDGMHKLLAHYFGKVVTMALQFPKATFLPVSTGCTTPEWLLNVAALFKAVSYQKYEEEFMTLARSSAYCAGLNGSVLGVSNKEEFHNDVWSGATPKLRAVLPSILSKMGMEYVNYETYLGNNMKRNSLTLRLVQDLISKGRKVLVLSKRTDPLEWMHKEAVSRGIPSALLLGGSMPTGVKAYEKYKVSMKYAETEARVVFGISQLARQGLDIDSLDTIIFHLPIKDVEQPIGRILRVAAGKRSALALFLVDEHKIAEAMLKKAAETCQANASPARRHTYTQVLAKLAE